MTVQVVGVTAEQGRLAMDQLGVEADRQALIAEIGNAPKGGIIFVKGYESKGGHGEVADYFYLKGVNYAAMKERSLAQLLAIATNPTFQIEVTCNQWFKPTGEVTTAACKVKILRKTKTVYKYGDPALLLAIQAIERSITNPQQREAVYEQEANGVYAHGESGQLHIRDCQLLCKNVLREGDWPIKTSSPDVALKDAVRRLLAIGKYRQVVLDGRFDYITVAGQIIMQDESGNQTFIGFAEDKGRLVPRIPDLEREVELEKTRKDAAHVAAAISDMLA